MAYQPDGDLNVAYSPGNGPWHFVLSVESHGSSVGAFNAPLVIEGATSAYVEEWLDRLVGCEPDALHVARVEKSDAPKLWYPCVRDDPESPSAIGGDGCVCRRTFRDPVTLLPVVAHHFRTVGGDVEEWRYLTYAPLALPEGERLSALVVDREATLFWVRTARGTLHLLPEDVQGSGYGVGHRGGGATDLARIVEKIVRSNGLDVSAGPTRAPLNEKVYAWVSSRDADRTREIPLARLERLCRTGTPG